MRRTLASFGVVLIASMLAACTTTPAATPSAARATPIDAHTLLDQAGQTIRATKAVKLKLQVSGAPAFIQTTSAGLIQFLSLDGQYQSPDRVAATVKAKLLGISGQVDVVAIGDDQWYENAVLTGGKFLKDTFSPGFNAGRLVSSDQGITSALGSVTSLKLVGTESQFGTQVYHLTGVADGAQITALTVGLIVSKAPVNVDIYIDTASLRAVDVVLTQPETISATESKPTVWDLELFDYDVAANVTPPANAITVAKATSNATTAATLPVTQAATLSLTQAVTSVVKPAVTSLPTLASTAASTP